MKLLSYRLVIYNLVLRKSVLVRDLNNEPLFWHNPPLMRETFRVWGTSLETFVLEVIFGKRHDFKAIVLRTLLPALFRLFRIGVNIRRRLFNLSF